MLRKVDPSKPGRQEPRIPDPLPSQEKPASRGYSMVPTMGTARECGQDSQ